MRNGGWEQRRAGPGAPAAAHQPPDGPSFPLELQGTAPPFFQGDPGPTRARGRSLRAHPAPAGPSSAKGGNPVLGPLRGKSLPQQNPHTLNHARASQTSRAGHPPPPRASSRPEGTGTCWFSFARHLPSPPRRPQQSGPAGWLHLAQVGAGARGPPCAEPESLVGWGAEDSELRTATPSLRLVAPRVAWPFPQPLLHPQPRHPRIGSARPAWRPSHTLVFLSRSSLRPRSPNPDPGTPGPGPHREVASANRRTENTVPPTSASGAPGEVRAGAGGAGEAAARP